LSNLIQSLNNQFLGIWLGIQFDTIQPHGHSRIFHGNCIVWLIPKEGNGHNRDTGTGSFTRTVQATMGNEGTRIWMV
jgi:hypothetical protein